MFKDKYKREHDTEFILFNAAKQSLKAHFPDQKYPLIKTLRAEIKELYAEKNKLYPEYYEAKGELKDVMTAKNNVDYILGRDSDTGEKERGQRDKDKNKDDLE